LAPILNGKSHYLIQRGGSFDVAQNGFGLLER
jgi:hypothetical protein